MKTRKFLSITLAILAAVVTVPVAIADDASCDVREKGKNISSKSGNCSVSESHNIVTIRLRDGERYTLTPSGSDDHYKDQENRSVKMNYKSGEQVYNWEHRHISVAYNSHNSRSNSYSGNSTPEVIMGRNGEGEVIFNNDCVVYYNSNGRRLSKNDNCGSGQGGRADDAMADYRRNNHSSGNYQYNNNGDPEAGFADYQAQHGGNNNNSTPEIVMGRNGEGEVIFNNDCVVYYNSNGRRRDKNNHCNNNQGQRADDAMASYRREQGY